MAWRGFRIAPLDDAGFAALLGGVPPHALP